jgi:hypothetical protein
MSLYFDGAIFCDLKSDVPQQVIDTLQYMARVEDYTFDSPPDHDFFKVDGWRDWLRTKVACAPGFVGCEFRKVYRYTQQNVDYYRYTLSFRRCMHDDVAFYVLWWLFLPWLAPYSETTGYVGYYREEYTLHPTLIYFKNSKVCVNEITQNPIGLLEKESWSDE